MVLKYISLFSGIGGFEVAIHRLYPRAVCIGYSEIDPKAIAVYEKKFATHLNLGDVKKISKRVLDTACKLSGGCDLLVAGFPCNDLTSMKVNGEGLHGDKSGLFFEMLRIIRHLKDNNPRLHIIIENNHSMSNKWKIEISSNLRSMFGKVYMITLDSKFVALQARKRVFWTSKQIPLEYSGIKQTWRNVLEPSGSAAIRGDFLQHVGLCARKNALLKMPTKNTVDSLEAVEVTNGLYRFVSKTHAGEMSRWLRYPHHSDTLSDHTRTIFTTSNDCILLDRRGCAEGTFRIRRFTVKELARLFTFDDDHLPEGTSVNAAYGLFGKAVVVKVVEHVLKHLLK